MDINFKKIFDQSYSPLCNYALKFVMDRDVAEDIVQDLFIQIWEENKLVTIKNHSGYLVQATKFKCINYLRSKKNDREIRVQHLPDFDFERTTELKEEDIEPLLHYFASKLPPKTREVFLLSRQSKLSYREIALELNISVKTVEGQMSRALKIMRLVLKDQEYFIFILLCQIQ